MKATGIVRRIDDLGRVVIPKEIRRTMRIREGEPSYTSLTPFDNFCFGVHRFVKRYNKTEQNNICSVNFIHSKLISQLINSIFVSDFKLIFSSVLIYLLSKNSLSSE